MQCGIRKQKPTTCQLMSKDKYHNLPIGWSGPDMLLYTEQLPSKYQVLGGSGLNKEHICLRYNIEEFSSYFRGRAFCGYELEYGSLVEGVSIHPCESCLSILNKEMEGYLYDEEKKEYYNPRSR